MKHPIYLLPVLVVLLFAYLFFGVDWGKQKPAQVVETKRSVSGEWETKTSTEGGVTVKVTPLQMSGTQWKFDIAFDTHTVSLDQDPMMITTLVDDKGNVHKPLSWEGGGAGGHHREGTLLFEAVNPVPPFVELKIANVGGVSERSFRWSKE